MYVSINLLNYSYFLQIAFSRLKEFGPIHKHRIIGDYSVGGLAVELSNHREHRSGGRVAAADAHITNKFNTHMHHSEW